MSYYSSKRVQQQFSTADLRESKGYSSRFQKLRMKRSNIKQSLPYHLEKAAIVIQKFWRHRMAMRRRFYQCLIQQLHCENQAYTNLIKQKQMYFKGVSKQVEVLQKLNQILVENQTKDFKITMKNLAKDCVGIAFKLEKRMLSERQLNNLMEEKKEAEQRIAYLKNQKETMRQHLIHKTSQNEQIILRQIKQANAQLLRIVRQKNSLKHKIKQKQVNTSIATDY